MDRRPLRLAEQIADPLLLQTYRPLQQRDGVAYCAFVFASRGDEYIRTMSAGVFREP